MSHETNESITTPLDPNTENSLLGLFKALESDTDLDKLNSFGNSTPKFSMFMMAIR